MTAQAELEREILEARDRGDEARVRELQARYRLAKFPVERVVAGGITLREGATRSAPTHNTPARKQLATGAAAGVAIVFTVEAQRQFAELPEFGDSDRELGGFLYGHVGDDGELIVEAVTVVRDRRKLRNSVELDIAQGEQMADHFRSAGWRLLGDWHSHVRPGSPASLADRAGWLALSDHFRRKWVGVIVEPRHTFFGNDWTRPTFRSFLVAPGASEVHPARTELEYRDWTTR